MLRAAIDRPRAQAGLEIGEQAVLEVLPRRAGGQLGVDRGRPLDDVPHGFPIEERQGVGEHHARHPSRASSAARAITMPPVLVPARTTSFRSS